MKDELIARRSLLKAVVVGTIAVSTAGRSRESGAAPDAGLPPLAATDPIAVALGYGEDSTRIDGKKYPLHKATQSCSICVQFQGSAGAARGGCNVFTGRSVNAHGWCSAWTQKPAG
jgi:hypothetical protein